MLFFLRTLASGRIATRPYDRSDAESDACLILLAHEPGRGRRIRISARPSSTPGTKLQQFPVTPSPRLSLDVIECSPEMLVWRRAEVFSADNLSFGPTSGVRQE